MNCEVCDQEIPAGRLKALPNTRTCTDCSEIAKVGAFTVISGKTEYCELQILPAERATQMKKLQNRQTFGPNVKLSSYSWENSKDNREPKD
jgi:hypothetical protein